MTDRWLGRADRSVGAGGGDGVRRSGVSAARAANQGSTTTAEAWLLGLVTSQCLRAYEVRVLDY